MPARPFVLNLFGPFEAQYNGRPLTGFATDKIRALLAYLAVESDKPHRRETLAGLLWPDYPDAIARRNLRQSLYRLRQTLQEADPVLPDQLIGQTRQTVILNGEALTLDTTQFARGVREAKSAPNPMPLLTRITDLYRGELLAGLGIPDAYAFDEWLIIQRELFHQQALDTFSRLIAIHEARNDPDAVLATAARLLALDPWHEQTYRQIMRAQVSKGNRPQAVAQYNDLEAILQRELGVEPAAATTALYEQIRVETTLIGNRRVPAAQNGLRHFPAPLTPLIGRGSELDQLAQILEDPACRLLTVTGSGGIGKTRLCIETARRLADGPSRFTDGLVFISLAQVQHGGLLVSSIVQSLDLSLQLSSDPQGELLNHLKNRQILLVLDNFEHLLFHNRGASLPVAIAFLVESLASAPGITFCITSREPLSLQGEWVFALEGLSYASSNGDGSLLDRPAPQLFILSARRYSPTFDPSEHADDILEICRLTSGLPLALEMAAAWMRAYDCREIAQRIAQSLDFLTSPFRDVPARQRSIRAIIASTWDQLTPEQQSAIAAMSVFQGGFTVQAALSVAQASVLDLAKLVEKSLLRRAKERRYALHELVRQFAAEKLAESGSAQAAQMRHADYYFRFLGEQIPGFNGPNPQEAIVTARRATDNLRAAWQWAVANGQVTLLKQAVDGYALFLILTGASREGEEAYEQAFNALRQAGSERPEVLSLQSRLAAHLAWFQVGVGKREASLENASTAVALAARSQDALDRAYGLSILGWAWQTQGKYEEAEAALNEAVTLFNQAGKPLEASLALIRLGSIYWRKGEFEKTLTFYQQSLQIEQRLQNKRGINRAYGGIGLVYSYLGKYDKALEWLSAALTIDRELGNRFGIVRHLGNMGSVYLERGDYPQALACYQEAARIEQESDYKSTLAVWLGSIGSVYGQTGEYELALSYYDQAIALDEELGDRFNLCDALLGKGEILLLRGEYTEASRLVERVWRLADEIQRKESQFGARLLDARLLARTGNADDARDKLAIMMSILEEGEENNESRARIHYEFWRIWNEREHAYQALVAYQAAQTRVPKGEYHVRIAELKDFLSAPGAGSGVSS